jgi:hypothetical protein
VYRYRAVPARPPRVYHLDARVQVPLRQRVLPQPAGVRHVLPHLRPRAATSRRVRLVRHGRDSLPQMACSDAGERAQNPTKVPKSTCSDAGESAQSAAQNVILNGGVIGLSLLHARRSLLHGVSARAPRAAGRRGVRVALRARVPRRSVPPRQGAVHVAFRCDP